MTGRIPDETEFRCAAAPGLDEDALHVALTDGPGAVWGDDRPWPSPSAAPPPGECWDQGVERRRRHAALLRTWEVSDRPGARPPVPPP